MQNNNSNNYIQDGEIQLKELFNLLINSKKIIIVTTLFFSLIAAVYAYSLEPKYEASSVIEVSSYLNKQNMQIFLENPHDIEKKLKIKFIELPKKNNENSILQSISFFGQKYISMNSISTLPETAKKNIENVQQFLDLLLTNHKDRLITNIQTIIDQQYEDLKQLKINNEFSAFEEHNKIEAGHFSRELELIKLRNEMQNLSILLAYYSDEYNQLDNEINLLKSFGEEINLLKPSDYDETYLLMLGEKREVYKAIVELLREKRELFTSIEEYKIMFKEKENELELLELKFENNEKFFSKKKNKNEVLRKNKEEYIEKQIQVKLDEITKIKSLGVKNEYPITINQLPERKYIPIIMGFFMGLLLSIIVVLIRQVYLQEQK